MVGLCALRKRPSLGWPARSCFLKSTPLKVASGMKVSLEIWLKMRNVVYPKKARCRMDLTRRNREMTCVRLRSADVSEKRNDCFHGRKERQQEQGSESVDKEPWPHTLSNTGQRGMLRGFLPTGDLAFLPQ